MGNRNTRLIIKNSDVVNSQLPSSLLKGEAIVNTAEGIMMFSGSSSTQTNEWTPAGANTSFFEVGSNLYDLKLRNRITSYEDLSGGDLVGKFLSGTTDGFVLADITELSETTDSYLVDGNLNYTTGELTLNTNLGRPDVVITGFTNENTYTTSATLNGNILEFDTNETNNAYSVDLSALDTVDTYTINATLNGNILEFDTNLTNNAYSVDLSALEDINTYVTNLTYVNDTITLTQNNGEPDLTITINEFNNITINSLGNGVVYSDSNGVLKTDSGFEYDDVTNTLLSNNINTSSTGSMFVGTGGLTVGSGGDVDTPGVGDVLIHGNLTVFGDSISATTSELYIEDNNIILNYNPENNSSVSSEGAGFTIQDGDGINSDVTFTIRPMNGFVVPSGSSLDNVTEYSGPNGFSNRAFVTELNDIVLRSDNPLTPDGVRVLCELDVLDGGAY